MFRTVGRLLPPASLLLCAFQLLGHVAAAPANSQTQHFRGQGWSLTLRPKLAWYGSALTGTLTHAGRQYHVEGDWIPAADAGGDLLRFFGYPFPGNSMMGLVGLATFYNTCNPSCAAGVTYELSGIGGWTLPGTKVKTVRLKFQSNS